MTHLTPRPAAACIAISLGLMASLAGCDPRPPIPKATPGAGMGTGGSMTTPPPMPQASGPSQ